jgi:hypothetical protein
MLILTTAIFFYFNLGSLHDCENHTQVENRPS